MDIKTFEKIITHKGIPDEQVETAFHLLVKESENKGTVDALDLLKEHRLELGKKIAREILAINN